jgi:hypothetical protein
MPTTHRKKPVEIEAHRLDDSGNRMNWNAAALAVWCGGRLRQALAHPTDADSLTTYIDIETLEGTMTASPGDWIIRGVQGEFYPCKPEIFEATYDQIETEEQHA